MLTYANHALQSQFAINLRWKMYLFRSLFCLFLLLHHNHRHPHCLHFLLLCESKSSLSSASFLSTTSVGFSDSAFLTSSRCSRFSRAVRVWLIMLPVSPSFLIPFCFCLLVRTWCHASIAALRHITITIISFLLPLASIAPFAPRLCKGSDAHGATFRSCLYFANRLILLFSQAVREC